MPNDDETVGVRLDEQMRKRLDEHAERLAAKGVRVSRSDAIRNALDRGLSQAERRAGTTRGETGSATPKTRRGE